MAKEQLATKLGATPILEIKCELCNGLGWTPGDFECGMCDGTGYKATELGDRVLEFLERRIDKILGASSGGANPKNGR